MLLTFKIAHIITLIGATMSSQAQGLTAGLPVALRKRQGQCFSGTGSVAGGGFIGTWTINVSQVGTGIIHRPVSYPDISVVIDIVSESADTMRFHWQGDAEMPRNRYYFIQPREFLREHGVPEGSPDHIIVSRGSNCDITYDRGAGLTQVTVGVYRFNK